MRWGGRRDVYLLFSEASLKGGKGGGAIAPSPPLVGRIEGRAALLLAVLLFFLPLSYVVSKVFDHFVFPIIV